MVIPEGGARAPSPGRVQLNVKSRGRAPAPHSRSFSLPRAMAHWNLPASPRPSYTGSNTRVTGCLYAADSSTLPAVGVGLRQADVGQNAIGKFAGHGI